MSRVLPLPSFWLPTMPISSLTTRLQRAYRRATMQTSADVPDDAADAAMDPRSALVALHGSAYPSQLLGYLGGGFGDVICV